MRKTGLFIISFVFLLLCLSACGKKEVSDNKDIVKNEKSKSDKSKEDKKSKPKKKKEARVENNGGYFVGSDNLVYFRNSGEGLIGESALFGDFLTISKKGENSQICSYDVDSGEVEVEFEDSGFGEIYLHKDTFYLKEIDEENEGVYGNIYSIKTDGSDRKDITQGNILAMNPENGVYAVENYEDGVRLIELWQGDEQIYSFKDDKDEHVASFIESGHTDEYVLFLKNSYDETEQPELWVLKLDEGSELKKIGDFDMEEEDLSYSYPVIEQVAYSKDMLYFILALRSGTASTLQGAYLFEADLSEEDSLQLLDESVENGNEETVLEIWLDESGELKKGSHKPLSAWAYETDLMFCDEDENEKVLCPDLFAEDSDDNDMIKMMQKAEFVNGLFFVISCDARRYEEDDIGWREAYKCFGTSYFCIPAEEGSQEEVIVSTE